MIVKVKEKFYQGKDNKNNKIFSKEPVDVFKNDSIEFYNQLLFQHSTFT